ncbi:MAG: damage-inducible protein [Rhodospirillaceae bacterium]|nr:damage-inducible protein [Rhodospirillaceae bacterium]
MELTTMAANVAALLKERKCRLSVVESSAGGLISASLLSIPGASGYFVGGGIIYTRDARRALLGANEEVASMRGSCEEYALAAAKIIKEKLKTDWALCETGASGPSNNSYGDDAGHCCIAITGPIELAITIETKSQQREQNMWHFASAALDLLEATLRETEVG